MTAVLAQLQGWQRQVALPAAVLRALADEASPDATAAAALLPTFDAALAAHRRFQQQSLVPEMIEAMAGSDAVCIRELAEALAGQLQALQRQWRAVRGALAAGRPVAAADWRVLADGCDALHAREQRELLPMAARLLDDAALGRIAQAVAAKP
ncbi:MAG: hemerythrin domain-containing protein [Proteobacteria bacterium]|nr:hemerythrin domain-containing protein [Pseudomonadota bacterium]